MSDAFKCKRCNEFNEGQPCRIKVKEYGSAGFTGWTNSKTIKKMELCEECRNEFEVKAKSFTDTNRDINK